MTRVFTTMIQPLIRRAGFDIVRRQKNGSTYPPDFSDLKREIYDVVMPYTMTSPERVGDRAELDRAFDHLRPGGHLVVLCPAHNWLYSPFDEAVGHYRRYNKRMYRQLSDRQPLRIEYLDSVGLLASIANKLLLKQAYPSEKQIKLWDRLFVRLSTVVDPATLHLVGKSLLGVWRR